MELVLNELSCSSKWPNDEASSLYDAFFGICLDLEENFKKKITIKYSQYNNEAEVIFRNDPNFLKWLTFQKKEKKLAILSMLTGGQFIIEYPYYKVFDKEGQGIGYAHENTELLLSFQSEKKWMAFFLNIVEERLNEETTEVESTELKIGNCYNEESKKYHRDFLHNRFQHHNNSELLSFKREILRGSLLWKKKEILFPNLIFCSSTEKYIVNIQSGDILSNLLTRLHEYETYFKTWHNGDFDRLKVGGKARLESDSRVNNYQELVVMCPDGKNRLFSYHCNYGISGFRLHFIPDTNSRKCIIGYIGKKIV